VAFKLVGAIGVGFGIVDAGDCVGDDDEDNVIPVELDREGGDGVGEQVGVGFGDIKVKMSTVLK
jgi:hypothetical protein